MKRKGFTLVEIIISIALVAVVGTIFTISFIHARSDKNTSGELMPTESEILKAAKVYLSVNFDKEGKEYLKQLALGAQGVKVSVSKLIEDGLLEDTAISTLKDEIKQSSGVSVSDSEAKSYYVLALKGTLDSSKKDTVCEDINYYLSWRENFNQPKQVYFCGNLPENKSILTKEVTVKEAHDDNWPNYTSYIYGASGNTCQFTLKDESGQEILPNANGRYNLTYAKKYFVSYDLNNCYSSFVDLYAFNESNAQIYLTLQDVVSNGTPTKTFDLSKHLYYSKPTYRVNYLSNMIGRYGMSTAQNAQQVLNYNNITPYPIYYEKAQREKTSITISTSSKYCYGTRLDVVSDTSVKQKKKFKLGGSVTCKKYTSGDSSWFIGKYTLLSTSETATKSPNDIIYNGTGIYLLQEEIGDAKFSGQEYYFTPTQFDDGYYYDYDDDGMTYFYRGDVNNYVSFAGLLWRIVRINGDKSIRLILDGDAGTTNWNDSTKYEYYNAYMYGTIAYYPLISSDARSKRENIDYSSSFCYSDGFTYNKNTNKYQLAGDIFCERITKDNYITKVVDKYTLKSTSKTATSTKLYKFGYRYSDNINYVYTYDTEDSTSKEYTSSNSNYAVEISPSKVCLGSDYTIDGGQYKLSGKIYCDVSLSSSNYKSYKNYYILKGGYNNNWLNDKTSTGTKMYKFLDCPNCRSGSWSRYDYYLYKVYQSPVHLYTDSSANQSKPYELLDSWYSANLSAYDGFITTSTFCNDTSNSGGSNASFKAYTRLTYSSKAPTFKCNNTFDYGGKYRLKIGLITADELAFAGAAFNSANSNYYMAYNKSFWTMTPATKTSMFTSNMYENSESYSGGAYYTDSLGYYNEVDTQWEWDGCAEGSLDCTYYGGYSHSAINYNVFSTSLLTSSTTPVSSYDSDNGIVVRPVINLNSDVLVNASGTGTYGNPYVVDTKWSDYEYVWFTGDVG